MVDKSLPMYNKRNPNRNLKMKTDVQKMSDLRISITQHILDTGDTVSDTANALECSRKAVYDALDDGRVQEIMQQAIGAKLVMGGISSANSLVRLASNARSEYVQLQAADSVLDRIGFKPVDRSVNHVSGEINISIDLG
jgi:transposase-like protein